MYSDDGITWTDTNCGCAAAAVAWGNGLFVAFPGTGSSLTSSDGKVWTPNAGAGVFGASLTFARGQFFAVTGTSLYSSTDGTHWTLDYTRPGIRRRLFLLSRLPRRRTCLPAMGVSSFEARI